MSDALRRHVERELPKRLTKFRSSSTNKAVKDIVEGLVRSYKAGIPASLQFVADRLFASGDADLGERVRCLHRDHQAYEPSKAGADPPAGSRSRAMGM